MRTVFGFVLLGLAPLACAAFVANLIKFESFLGLGSLEPALKTASFERAERAAQAILHRGWLLSSLGALVAAALAAWSFRSGAGVPTTTRARGDAATVGVALALAAGLFLLAAPMKRENEMPWPAGELRARLGGETPQLEAPDPLAPGPVVMLSRTALIVDGVPEPPSALRDRFLVYRNNFGLLRPGQSFPATIALACTPDARADAVLQVLSAAHQAGYRSVTLLFDRRLDVARPILGPLTLHRMTGARAALLGPDQPAPPGGVVVRATDAPICAGISERIASARQQGRDVSVVVGLAPGP